MVCSGSISATSFLSRKPQAASRKPGQLAFESLVVVIAVAACNPGPTGNSSTTTRPPLAIEPATLDLGQHPWNSRIPFELKVTNQSEHPLILVRTDTSCDCTVLEASSQDAQRELAAGASTVLRGVINSEVEAGTKVRRVSVVASQPLETKLIYATAAISIATTSTYEIEPLSISFGDVQLGSVAPVSGGTTTRDLVFRPRGAVLIQPPAGDADWIFCRATAQSADECKFELGVHVDRLMPGPNLATVTFQTDDPNRPACAVTAVARGVADAMAYPTHVFVRTKDPPQSVRILDRRGRPLAIDRVTLIDSDLLIAVEKETGLLTVSCPTRSPPDSTTIGVLLRDGREVRFRVSPG